MHQILAVSCSHTSCDYDPMVLIGEYLRLCLKYVISVLVLRSPRKLMCELKNFGTKTARCGIRDSLKLLLLIME